MQGELTIVVTFGGDPIAKSPFTVGVAAPLDLSKVNVDNLDGRKSSVSCLHTQTRRRCDVIVAAFIGVYLAYFSFWVNFLSDYFLILLVLVRFQPKKHEVTVYV